MPRARNKPLHPTIPTYNRNPHGNNQWGGKVHECYSSCYHYTLCLTEISYQTGPLDDEFKEILWGYNKNGVLGYNKIIRRLADEHGIKIGYVFISLSGLSLMVCQPFKA